MRPLPNPVDMVDMSRGASGTRQRSSKGELIADSIIHRANRVKTAQINVSPAVIEPGRRIFALQRKSSRVMTKPPMLMKD
ncbi:MAG: hypothetical protein AB7L36_12100, partial [Sphingomonadaceae bacterium]